ncbi:hypothetical protein F4821DRAFT_279598 [Hypoxylon rubiginosum]|uniref:Uncharacterized protein n=1 Tax=Hypoxylon rubiginosum TaxID=110542 RepID=A0ACC0DIF6_9PEZI|nr:hypothetical protein F4821DRAFT_279598 [Hypoxylon rubiginosum]
MADLNNIPSPILGNGQNHTIFSLQDQNGFSPQSQHETPLHTQDELSSNEQTPQNQDSRLLQLAPELVNAIADFLKPVDRVLFAQTCRSARAKLFEGPLTACRLSRNEYITYLTAQARALPDKWACEKCMVLHPVVDTDTPTSISKSSCPLSHHNPTRIGNLSWKQIPIKHHHIQLALKYTRLQHHGYDYYLKALLKPYYLKGTGMGTDVPLEIRYSAYPKIIKDDNGNLKFLLASNWRYSKDHKRILLHHLGYHQICPHLEWNYCNNCSKRFCDKSYHDSPCHTLYRATETVVEDRCKNQRIGACPRCPTDYSVQLMPEYLDLWVFQDFGSECSPIDLAWTTHCYNGPWGNSANWRKSGPTLYHEPGSVEKWFD